MNKNKYIELVKKDGTEVAYLFDTPENMIMVHTLYKLQQLNRNSKRYRIEKIRKNES